jgi:hypothetical protein
MKVIQTTVEIEDDRIIRVQLPLDTPRGKAVALLVLDIQDVKPADEERRAAIESLTGSLAGPGFSLQAFLDERMEDDRRRDRALGL